MKIAYLGQMADVATENGISKKIRTQTQAWLAAGHTVRYFSLVPTSTVWPGLAALDPVLVERGGSLTRAVRSFTLARAIRAWQPDAIYFRYAYHSPGLPALFRQIPTVAELNSDDQTEYPLTLSRAKLLYHRLTRARVLRAARGYVAVTRELAQRFAAFGRPTEVIANSITLADFAPAPEPASPPSLVFVGSPGSPWHGLDRVAEIGALLPQWTIDVVGTARAEWPGPGAPAANMRFHGHLSRERYEPIVRRATAALGTMALFRNQMEEACSLKVREYLALGLPVIAAHEDTDVPATADYFLRLPNNAVPLGVARDLMLAFLEHWKHRRVPRADVAHLDTSVKEARRLAFLARIARTARAPA